MNSRLQQFLDIEKLSPARLADMLGVQRSGLSHILSGRNKPGYDFIFKFLNCFPTINAEWLLTGKGKPYKDLSDLPSFPDPNLGKATILDKNEDFFSFSSSSENNNASVQAQHKLDNQPNKDDFDISKLTQNGINTEIPKNTRKNKTVKRVIIFYNDGSFDEMYPTM